MKATDIMQDVNEGYIAVWYSQNDWLTQLQGLIVANTDTGTPIDKLHTTVMYSSDTPVLDLSNELKLDGKILKIRNLRYSVFGPNKDNIVIEFDNTTLQDLNEVYKASGEKPSEISAIYRPHITMVKVSSEEGKAIEITGCGLSGKSLPELPEVATLFVGEHISEEVEA